MPRDKIPLLRDFWVVVAEKSGMTNLGVVRRHLAAVATFDMAAVALLHPKACLGWRRDRQCRHI